MKYHYKVIYSVQKDIWNWRQAISNSFMETNWSNNIDNDNDRKIAQQIVGLKKQSAEAILKPYLISQKNNPNSKLNKFIQIANEDFDNKFVNACQTLEQITKHPMMSNKFTFYVTTFPRMPYIYEKSLIFLYDSVKDFWGTPIDGFLHEALHFQFISYWRNNPNSQVSKLNYEKFDYLKEALTVVLDEKLKPLITVVDQGYPSQTKYRKLLHKHWQKYQNFEQLVNYGLSILDTSFQQILHSVN